jgi:hypothetical protein
LLVSIKQRERNIDIYDSMTKDSPDDLRRIHRDHHGSPDSPDDHLSERVLGNVWSVLEPLVTHLRDHRCLRWFLLYSKTLSVDIR